MRPNHDEIYAKNPILKPFSRIIEDERGPPRKWVKREGEEVPAQEHLSGNLFALRQQFRPSGLYTENLFPVVPGMAEGAKGPI